MSQSNEKPLVTVIMPIRNEEKFIRRSLGAVLAQDYPHNRLEVVIADGMSTDKTRELIEELGEQHPDIPITIVDNPEKIVPHGFNNALRAAKGDIIVRVDGHTIIEEDYVSQCVDALQRTDSDNVGGRMDAVGETLVAQAIAFATSSPFGVGGAKFHYSQKEEQVDTVYMGAWWRRVFDQIGGFDERFIRSQDSEFNYRLRAHGGKILLSPKIKSTYYARSSLPKLWKQYYQYGYYKVQVIFRHPTQFRARQLVPPAFILGLAGGIFIAPFSTVLRVLWLIGVALYLTGSVVFSLRIALREGIRYLPTLLIIFPILHFSWGFGFLDGLINVVLRRRAPERYKVDFQLE